MTLVEHVAKAFCEAEGLYRWEDTHGLLRQWYLKGAAAAIQAMAQFNAPGAPSYPSA
jgi:hypothetical protein